MKTVLKCDFCTHTEVTSLPNVMAKHEAECTFNPALRTCFTCANGDSEPYRDGHFDACKEGKPCSEMFAVQDGDVSCGAWKLDER